MNVWLARHGETRIQGDVAVGWTDPGLSDEGRRQAAEMAHRLAGVRVGRVLSSDLRRARETAEVVARAHGLPVAVDPDLRELSFGAWEGRRLADLWSESPDEAAAWEADVRALPTAFGESFAAFQGRVLRAVRRIVAVGLGDGVVVVVAHRGPLALLHAHLAGMRVEAALRLPCPPGHLVRVVWPRAHGRSGELR